MNMQWNNIVGHKQVIAQLCLMQQEDRVPHAMLFCGTDGVGKSLVAEAMAAAGSVVFLVNGWLRMKGVQLKEVMEIKHRYNKTRPYKHGKAF